MSNCLKLYTDKTVAIRIRLAQMLPELRDKMKDKDKANIGLVELILEKFSSDKVVRVQE
jgi:D-lyxose ketol-isomerase